MDHTSSRSESLALRIFLPVVQFKETIQSMHILFQSLDKTQIFDKLALETLLQMLNIQIKCTTLISTLCCKLKLLYYEVKRSFFLYCISTVSPFYELVSTYCVNNLCTAVEPVWKKLLAYLVTVPFLITIPI
jgi:hypothetical protein